ncbi:MAG: hypothetical protein ACRCXL_12615 [Dermatophilaceae bacterium]
MSSSDDEGAPYVYNDPTAPPPEPATPPGATTPLPQEDNPAPLDLPGPPAAPPTDDAPATESAPGHAATVAYPPPPPPPPPSSSYPQTLPYPEPTGSPQQGPTQPGGYPQPAAYGQPQAYGQPVPQLPAGAAAPTPPYATGYPPPPLGYPPPPYTPPGGGGVNVSAIVLTAVSAIGSFCCFFSLPSLVIGIVALTKQHDDPEGSRRWARIGWVVFGVLAAVVVIGVALWFSMVARNSPSYDGY